MTSAAHEKSRRWAFSRLAALTATVFGAALLSVPAAAAEAIDCEVAMCPPSFDYNSDGHQDLLAVRESDGNLMFYAGKGDGTLQKGVSRGADWGRMDIVMAGDLTGDEKPDLLGRDNRTGYLYTYPGNGSGDFGSRITVGRGWNEIGLLTTSIAPSAAGRIDLYAISRDQSTLYGYPGLGNGKFGARSVINDLNGWDWQNTLTTLDGELLAFDGWSDRYGVHNVNGIDASYDPSTWLEFWPGAADDRYRQVSGVGDLDGDSITDLAGIDSRTNALVLNSFNERNGSALHEPQVVGTGWGGMRLPSTVIDRTYDLKSNNSADIIARQSLTGEVRIYHAADGQAGTVAKWGDFSDMNLMETAGDLNGDGFPDLITRTSASGGVLYLHPGDGEGRLGTRIPIGSSWNSMSAIVSGHDFNVDGKVDVVAREKATGDLWLYPGDGNGALRPRVKIDTGWETMREITAVGDLDHDSHPDILAVHSTNGCLYLYGGTGVGGVKSGVKLGCGWEGMDALAAVGDMNHDGHTDFIARRTSDGSLRFYRGTGTGSFLPAFDLAGGFGAKDIIA
jgi:hypothetical protein